MGLRFRKSVKIAPGLKLNFNKKSVSVTAGVKGAHVTVNSKGKKTTSVGIPGSGLYYSKTSKTDRRNKNKDYLHQAGVSAPPPEGPDQKPPKKSNFSGKGKRIFFGILTGLLGIAAIGGIMSCFESGAGLIDIAMLAFIFGLMGLSLLGVSRSKKSYSDGEGSIPPLKKVKHLKLQ